MPVNIDSIESYGQQTRLASVEPTDIIPWERGGAPASILAATLADFIEASITAGAKIDFGASPVGLSPSVGDVFFDTDDGIVYQYELAGWAAKLDFVSSAELASAIANFLTQTAADARYPLKTATDPYPTYLTQTEAAALFSPIGGDAQGGLRYSLSLTTTAPPATGQVRFNNAAIASVTQIFIHESDRNSAAQSEILDVVAVGTRIQVALEDNEEIYAWFRVSGAVVDNGSDRTIPVAFVSAPPSVVFVAGEVTVNFLQIQGTASGGGATGLKFTLNTAAGTPAAGEIRSSDLAAGGTIAVNPADTQANATDILGALKVGAIVDLRNSDSKWVRGTVTTAWTTGSGSFAIGSVRSAGAIANTETVYLSIASDAPTPGPAGSGSTIRVRETDGSLNDLVTDLIVPNGSLSISSGIATLQFAGAARTFLTADRTYYVRLSGNDTNDGLSVGTAFASIAKAESVFNSLDPNGYNVTINFTEAFSLSAGLILRNLLGAGTLTLDGNGTGSLSSAASNTIDRGLIQCRSAYLALKNFSISHSVASSINWAMCIRAHQAAQVSIQSINFGTLNSAAFCAHLLAEENAIVDVVGGYNISGGGGANSRHLFTRSGGTITTQSATVNISGAPLFTDFAEAASSGIIQAFQVTYSGAVASGVRKYNARLSGIVDQFGSGGSFPFPGNIAGVSSTGYYN